MNITDETFIKELSDCLPSRDIYEIISVLTEKLNEHASSLGSVFASAIVMRGLVRITQMNDESYVGIILSSLSLGLNLLNYLPQDKCTYAMNVCDKVISVLQDLSVIECRSMGLDFKELDYDIRALCSMCSLCVAI